MDTTPDATPDANHSPKGLGPVKGGSIVGKIIGVILLLVMCAGGYAAYDAYTFLRSPASATPQEVIITIEPGVTFDRVAWQLKKQGAITDVPRFRLLAQYKKALGTIKAGDFAVNTGWTPDQVLWQITKGQPVLFTLTIREGLTWWETAKAIEAQGFAKYDDIKKLVHDTAFLRKHNIPFATAEGFLYPETYKLRKPKVMTPESAAIVANLLVTTFWQKTKPVWTTLPVKKGEQLEIISPVQTSASPLPAAQPVGMGKNASISSGIQANVTLQNATLSGNSSISDSGGSSNIISSLTNATMPQPTQGPNIAQHSEPSANGNATALPHNELNATITTYNANSTAKPTVQYALPRADQIDEEALKELIIMASLVEKETGLPEERPRVAGVYANRLKINMLLQCDPTIIYGIGEAFKGSILRSQIQDASNRYNTYQHAGLPPGPISSFGLDAIKAAANPEQHDYYYFVATGVDKGHTFSKNLTEHNKAVTVYRNNIRNRR